MLSTPAPALGHGTEQERNFDAQVRRDALRKLHCECILQEQRLEKSRQASRDHTLAADCAETLTFLQLDTHMRIRSHRKQLSEAAQKRRALELKWQTEGVEERLKERADERAKQAARVGGAYLTGSVGGDYSSSSGAMPPAKGLQRYQELVRKGN